MASAMASAVPLAGRASIPARRTSRSAPARRASVRARAVEAPANLERVTGLASCAPLTDLVVADVAREGAPQLHALCGRGPHAALRTLRYGHKVNEMARSELPGHPCAIWTIARAPDGCTFVAESGLSTRADLDAMAAKGVKCFLIGEALMRADDVEAATRALIG